MRTTTLAVATLVAAASLAGAVPDRPKIYFPRQIKRFTNTTIETTPATLSTPESTLSSSSTTKRDGIFTDIIASLTGGLTSKSSDAPSSSNSGSASSSKSSEVAPIDTDPPVIIVIPSTIVVFPSNTDTPTPSSTSAPPTITDSSSSTDTSSVSDTSSGIVLLPTGVVTTSSSEGGGLLTPILTSLIGDLSSVLVVPTANSTDLPTETSTLSSVPALETPTETLSETLSQTPSQTPLLPIEILPTITLFPSETGSSTSASSTPQETGIFDPITSLFPGTGIIPSTTVTEILPTLPPVLNGTESSTIPSETITTESTLPSETGSSLPSYTPTISDSPTNTSATATASDPPVSATDPPVSSNSTLSAGPTSVPVPTSFNGTFPSSTSEAPFSASSTSEGVKSSPAPTYTSVPATATITDSESWLPTTILVQPSTSVKSEQSATATATGLPTGLPSAITPGGSPQQPPDTILIQLAFKKSENYDWIASTPRAAAQLFSLIPPALAFAGGYSADKAVMHSIVPYNTYKELGYATSMALVYIPKDSFDQLRLDHKIAASALYQNPDVLIYNMTDQINSAIDITLGSRLAGDSGSASNGNNPTSTPNNNDPFSTGSSDDNTSGGAKGTTVAIAVGIAGVASAYGAAMFLIARRYKRRKQRHQRTSSLTSPSDMRQAGSPALMGGALLSRDFSAGNYGGVAAAHARDSQGSGRSGMNNSGRTAFISAPVAAENSLGWN